MQPPPEKLSAKEYPMTVSSEDIKPQAERPKWWQGYELTIAVLLMVIGGAGVLGLMIRIEGPVASWQSPHAQQTLESILKFLAFVLGVPTVVLAIFSHH